MSNLLQVSRIPNKVTDKAKTFPLYMEFKVNPETAPFLVSGAKSATIWVDEPSDVLKAGVRSGDTPGDVFKSIIQSVILRGRELQWGNVHPFTEAGTREAIKHVQDYDFEELEILVAPFKKGEMPKWLHPQNLGFPVRWSSWLPQGVLVVVPKEREYVGLLGHLGPKHLVYVVHNAARGIAVATEA